MTCWYAAYRIFEFARDNPSTGAIFFFVHFQYTSQYKATCLIMCVCVCVCVCLCVYVCMYAYTHTHTHTHTHIHIHTYMYIYILYNMTVATYCFSDTDETTWDVARISAKGPAQQVAAGGGGLESEVASLYAYERISAFKE
jgi:hypothetical protein